MKKTLALILMLVFCFSLLTACGDPVEADFENYLNVATVEVNNNYTKLTEEVGNWANLESDEALAASLNDTLIPLVNDSIAKLEAISPETEPVQALKAQYVAVYQAYKEAFSLMSSAASTGDEAQFTQGEEKLSEGVELLNTYNAGLETLAAEYGYTVEY